MSKHYIYSYINKQGRLIHIESGVVRFWRYKKSKHYADSLGLMRVTIHK